jgi:hypothetical protein
LAAIAARFFPIGNFWRRHNYLPETDEAIAGFSALLQGESGYRDTWELGEPQWQLMETRPPSTIVADFINIERSGARWPSATSGE